MHAWVHTCACCACPYCWPPARSSSTSALALFLSLSLLPTLPQPIPPKQVETLRFNATYSRKDERTPLVDFLLLAASKAKAIYSQAYAELTRQVGVWVG